MLGVFTRLKAVYAEGRTAGRRAAGSNTCPYPGYMVFSHLCWHEGHHSGLKDSIAHHTKLYERKHK